MGPSSKKIIRICKCGGSIHNRTDYLCRMCKHKFNFDLGKLKSLVAPKKEEKPTGKTHYSNEFWNDVEKKMGFMNSERASR